jgi:hypothetical protein
VIQNDWPTCFVRLVAEPQLGNYGYWRQNYSLSQIV